MDDLAAANACIRALESEVRAMQNAQVIHSAGSSDASRLDMQLAGLSNESNAMKAALIFIVFVFVTSEIVEVCMGHPLQANPNLVGLSWVVFAVLVVYFLFIFLCTGARFTRDKSTGDHLHS